MSEVLGLDFGNVIKNTQNGSLMSGVVESLMALKSRFNDRIFIISRSGDDCLTDNRKYAEYQRRVHLFLYQSSLDKIIPWKNVFFCKLRHEKAPIAANLGITHFVDDRLEVLSHMTTVPNRFALNPTADQIAKFPADGIVVVSSWKEITDHLHGVRD